MVKAIILLSGGLDSAVVLALALKHHRECHALSFNYGQRHRIELEYANNLANYYGVEQKIISIDPSIFQKSALVSHESVAKNRTKEEIANGKVPNTYVPARNTLFLAFAMGQAELLGAAEIHTGPNAMDGTPYPDCTPAFIQAFQGVLNVATKQALEGRPPKLITPLIQWDKAEIIRQAKLLNVPIEMTFSCYDPQHDRACGVCDACVLRADGLRANT